MVKPGRIMPCMHAHACNFDAWEILTSALAGSSPSIHYLLWGPFPHRPNSRGKMRLNSVVVLIVLLSASRAVSGGGWSISWEGFSRVQPIHRTLTLSFPTNHAPATSPSSLTPMQIARRLGACSEAQSKLPPMLLQSPLPWLLETPQPQRRCWHRQWPAGIVLQLRRLLPLPQQWGTQKPWRWQQRRLSGRALTPTQLPR